MNQTTRYVMDIYQVSVIIRDTFEYLIPKKEGYRADVYKQRKHVISTALNERHALSRFLAENKEAGEKIRQNISDFYDLVYGDESRAVFLENDNVVVDNGYASQLMDYIVGLHETIYDICNGFIKHAQETGTYEEELNTLVVKENAYYRCLASLVITDQIHNLFVEFNKEMHKSKGQATPQSNFIGNDLRKTIGFFKFVEEHANYDDEFYKVAVNKTKFVVDCMGGKEKIDETGEGLRKEILALHDSWLKLVMLSEAEWKGVYQSIVQQLIEYDKEMMAKANQTADNADATN